MSYETRYEAIKEDLRDIMTEIGKPFGQVPEEYVGDDYGFEFGLEAADGEIIHVTLLLQDGADNGVDDGGNISLRVNRGEETVMLVSPHNFTQEVFAQWDDDDLWDDKLDNLRVNVGEVGYRLSGMVGSDRAKP